MRDRFLEYETEDPFDVFEEESRKLGGSPWLALAFLIVLAALVVLYRASYLTEKIVP